MPLWSTLVSPATLVVTGFFPAVITRDDEQPLQAGPHALVTITLTSHGAQAPLTSGERFALWAGDDIGHGIISRQVYTAFGPS